MFDENSFGGKYVGPTNPDQTTWAPDEIDGYNVYKTKVMEAMHGETASSFESVLDEAKNKPDALATLGALIYRRADGESAEELGEPPAPIVRFWVANDTSPQLFEIAEAMGHDFNQEDQEIITATMLNKYFHELEKIGELDMETGADEFTEVAGVDPRQVNQVEREHAGRKMSPQPMGQVPQMSQAPAPQMNPRGM